MNNNSCKMFHMQYIRTKKKKSNVKFHPKINSFEQLYFNCELILETAFHFPCISISRLVILLIENLNYVLGQTKP